MAAQNKPEVVKSSNPQLARFRRLPRQLRRRSPFSGSIEPKRVPLIALGSSRPTLPFPHPWNYGKPIEILETFFHNADLDESSSRHNRYLDVPGFTPVLVTRDPALIRAISMMTGDKPGMFDRDTLPSSGIARATGADTLLYANGAKWKRQKKLSTPPFARTSLFVPERFHEFEETFRATVRKRLGAVRDTVAIKGEPLRVELEPEIKAIMLEMLVVNFFGAEVSYDEIRNRYVPALDTVINHIVRDTVVNKLGIPLYRVPSLTNGIAEAKEAQRDFERLTDLVIAPRVTGKGQWGQFKSDAPDDLLRGNIRVFLAGALEATTSYASWALSHLAHSPEWQDRIADEVAGIDSYSPESLASAECLNLALMETLRLTPSLYFHPRRATSETLVTTHAEQTIKIPDRTHILLDVWHANRHEDHWGEEITGHRADRFEPDRWNELERRGRSAKDMLHFGFGHGPRFCPGKSLGQLEVALVVGSCVKLFRFAAVNSHNQARAGVSTKPADGVRVDIHLRDRRDGPVSQTKSGSGRMKCPFNHGA
ncbi:MAG: cytochrome P450 [Phycisphaera sp.]|nr:MAG: cytochrome P450 [Phycisphaera sp.]